MSERWAIDASASKQIAKVQRSMRRVLRADPFCRGLDLRNCGFCLRNGAGSSRWYSLRDRDRNHVGEVWHEPAPKGPVRGYFGVMLIDGTTFEGSVFTAHRETLVCFRNAVEICRVYMRPVDKSPIAGNWRERLAEWIRRRCEKHWTVSVGEAVVGVIEMKNRPIQLLKRTVALKTTNGDLPINLAKGSDFKRCFDTVIPKETGSDLDDEWLAILFVVNVAFRVHYFGRDFV